jgi:cytochrome oxidase Cu insertion factor (SCO1/SenC/PrrC family)
LINKHPLTLLLLLADNALQQDDKANLFRVYPNPAKDILHIETNGATIFSLIDQSGKVLLTTNITGKGSIKYFGYNSGLYY